MIIENKTYFFYIFQKMKNEFMLELMQTAITWCQQN